MKLTALTLALFGLGIPCSASNISGAADLIGTTFTVAGGVSGQTGNDLVGVTALATFTNGTVSCTFAIVGSDSLCNASGQFSILVTPPTSQTTSADWILTNLRTAGAGSQMLSLQMNGQTGLTVFNPDVSAGHPTANSTCGSTITDSKQFGNCRSAGDTPGGTTTATASVLYSNAAHLASQAPNMDLWTAITLTFSASPLFTGGQTFQFKIDTDGVGSMVMDTPEPQTLSLGCLALGLMAGMKFLRDRRRS